MNGFTVEAPAESNPLSTAGVERALSAASSRDVNQIQSSTKQLQYWEDEQGYHTILQDVFLQRSLPPEVRLLSLIQLKNGIDKYWRKSATNAIRTDERKQIRDRLLQGSLEEPNGQLANLNSIVTAKIARYEFPSQWPDLFKELVAALHQAGGSHDGSDQLSRALLVTHHVVKELAKVRLQRNRQAFMAEVPGLLDTLQQLYFFKTNQWESTLSHSSLTVEQTRAQSASEQCLKILRRLVVSGYDFPHSHDEVRSFWNVTAPRVQEFLQIYLQQGLQNAHRIAACSHAKQLAKMHVAMGKDHPVSLALLPHTPDLVRSYWINAKDLRQRQLSAGEDIDDDDTEVYDAFNLRAILLLRACFKEAFNLSQPFNFRKSDKKEDPPKARQVFTNEILTKEFVNDLFQTIVSRFFIYHQSDIEEWANEPEEWDIKAEGDEDMYDRSVRSAAERLFLDITLHFKDLVIEPLLSTLHGIAATNDQPLMKDAVYSAIGIAAPILDKKFDINHFLSTTIISDLNQQDRMFSIVRRRIAITLARWVVVDIAEEKKSLVYEIFNMLLDEDVPLNTQSVRIMAGKRLQEVVDEIYFSKTLFAPYTSSVMSRLLKLIQSVNLPETKLALLSTVSTIISQMHQEVGPFAEQIVQILETLWADTNENLMKTVIVTILKKLVRSLNIASPAFQNIVLPIVKATIEPGSELQIYLLDEALDLWHAIVEHVEAPASDDLLSLLPNLLFLYETEVALERALRMTRSYIYLAPSSMLSDHLRTRILHASYPLLSAQKTSIIDLVTLNLELLVRSAEAMGGEEALHLITSDLITTKCLPHMLDSIHTNWESHQSTGPHKIQPADDWKNESQYLCILSRIILPSTSTGLSACAAFAGSKGLTLETFMQRLLDEIFGHMDAMSSGSEQKLAALATTRLLETGQSWILGRLQELMGMWTSLVTDFKDEEGGVEDTLVYPTPTPDANDIPENLRTAAVLYADPVHTIPLPQFIRHHLQNAVQQCGGNQAFQQQWLVNVDADVVKGFGELGIM